MGNFPHICYFLPEAPPLSLSLPLQSSDRMARDKSRGIKKATGGGRAAAAAGHKKTKVKLPNSFFLSDPKAVALVNGEDKPV